MKLRIDWRKRNLFSWIRRTRRKRGKMTKDMKKRKKGRLIRSNIFVDRGAIFFFFSSTFAKVWIERRSTCFRS